VIYCPDDVGVTTVDDGGLLDVKVKIEGVTQTSYVSCGLLPLAM